MPRRQLPAPGRSLALFVTATALLAGACSRHLATPEAGAPAAATTAPAAAHHFLTLSDIHFDPYYDPTLVAELFAQDASEWPAVFATSTVTTLMDVGESRHQQDTSYPLLASALQAVAGQVRKLPGQKVDYVLITGDFLAHDFDATFQHHFPDKGFDDYRAFVLKTMTFLRDQLAAAFPTTPVFPALGNNDAYCGDYGVAPGSDFLAATAGLWQPLIRQPISAFSRTGSYTVPHPVVPDYDFVVLNDIQFSINYPGARFVYPNAACDAATGDLPVAERSWLQAQLDGAAGQVVLAFHIPPGIDQYGTAGNEEEADEEHQGAFRTAMCKAASCDPPATCDCEAITDVAVDLACAPGDAFVDIVSAAVGKLDYVMAAHTHQDDFRVFQIPDAAGGGSVPVLVHFNPSISIHNGNNPGFQIFTYDPADGTLLDYTTHYLSNIETAGSRGAGDPAPAWEELYTFSDAYIVGGGLPAGVYDAAAVSGLIAKLRADKTFAAATYWLFHPLRGPVSGAGKIDDADWDVYLCTLDQLTKAEFASCYCGTDA